MTTITQLPVPPTTTDPDNFDPRADAFVGALPQFVTETNQVALEVMANRQAAEAASDATPWFAGTIYNQGDVVYSPSTYLSYRDSTGGLSNTDPANDPRWVSLNGQGQNLDAIEATLIEHDNRLDAIEAEPGNTVFDEGVATVADAKEFNFVGAGVTVTQTAPGRARVSIPGTDLGGVNATLVEHDQRLDSLEAEPDLAIRDEGMQITPAAISLNFEGAGVTANSDPQGNVTVSIPGGGAGGNPLVVQDEGMQIEDDALTLNFTGAGVTATSVDGVVTVTIPGGGGGSTSIAVDDEGLELTDMLSRLNFVGGGVVATETSPGVISVSIPGQTPITAADEGTQVEDDVKSINFVGAGVTATSDPSGNLTVSIPGGGAGGNPLVVQDEGLIIEPDATTLNFVGDLVIVTSVSPGFAQVRVRGPQIFDSPAPGTQGVSVKQSATLLELGPNIEKATFGNDGRVYLNAFGIAALDEGVEISSSNQLRALNFIGEGVTAISPFPGFVEINIPGGGASQSIAVADEGLELTAMLARLNFVGGGVMAEEIEPGVIQVSVPGETPITVLDEGAQVEADLMSINFVGDGVQATSDGAGNLTVTIPGSVEEVRFFNESQIDADGNTVTGLNTSTPGVSPVTSLNLGSTEASFAVTGGNGLSYASVDIGLGAVQITPTAPLPNNAKGNFSIAIGARDASGTPAETNSTGEIAIGGTTNGPGGAVSIGLSSSAGGVGFTGNDGAVALGQSSSANFLRSVAVGRSANVTDIEAVAVGNSASSAGFGVAVGTTASSGNSGVSVGAGAISGQQAAAIGVQASASQTSAIAIGYVSSANFGGAIALGASTNAAGLGAIAIGPSSGALDSGTSVGLSCTAGVDAVAIGSGATSLDAASGIAIGSDATLTNGPTAVNTQSSIAIGVMSSCDGVQNVALGASANTAVGVTNSVAIGYNSTAPASNQIQLGNSGQSTYVFGTVQDRSDARDKTEVRETELGLDFIMSLRPVDFKWDYREDYFTTKDVVQEDGSVKQIKFPLEKDGSKVRKRFHHGFIAQEVGASGYQFGGYQDHSVNNPGVEIQSLGYDEFIAPMVKAIQQQQAVIKALEARLAALEGGAA